MLFHTYHTCRNVFVSKIDYSRIYGIHRKRLTQHIKFCDSNVNINSSSYNQKTKTTSSFTYQYGIVREIDRRIQTDGLTLIPDRLTSLDLDTAKSQHQILIKTLRSLSIDIHTLPSNEFPDSVFIEDTTVIIDGIGEKAFHCIIIHSKLCLYLCWMKMKTIDDDDNDDDNDNDDDQNDGK